MKKILSGIMISLLLASVFAACDIKPKPPMPNPNNATDTSNLIDENRAKEIALEKAGIAEDGVRFDRVELDRDNGIWLYEVDFRHGDMEYDVDIDAQTGDVVGFETERETGF